MEEQMDSTLVILEKVNQFYSSSFGQLVSITIGLLAFVGVIVPMLITFYQNRQFKQEQDYILRKLEESTSELFKHIETEVSRKFESEKEKRVKEMAELREELLKEASKSKGGAFFIQANLQLDSADITNAIESYIYAIQNFMRAEDELNLQRALKRLTYDCLPKAWNTIFQRWGDYEKDIKSIADELGKRNNNGRYTDVKMALVDALNQALQRTHTSNK